MYIYGFEFESCAKSILNENHPFMFWVIGLQNARNQEQRFKIDDRIYQKLRYLTHVFQNNEI